MVSGDGGLDGSIVSSAGWNSSSPSGSNCTPALNDPPAGRPAIAVTAVMVTVVVLSSALAGIVSVNLLPLASVRLNTPPAGWIAAVATLLESRVDVTLMPVPVSGNGATGVPAIPSGVGVLAGELAPPPLRRPKPVAVTDSAPCTPVVPGNRSDT